MVPALAEFTLEWELPNLTEEEQNEIFPQLEARAPRQRTRRCGDLT